MAAVNTTAVPVRVTSATTPATRAIAAVLNTPMLLPTY